jgi:hypothetical protein
MRKYKTAFENTDKDVKKGIFEKLAITGIYCNDDEEVDDSFLDLDDKIFDDMDSKLTLPEKSVVMAILQRLKGGRHLQHHRTYITGGKGRAVCGPAMNLCMPPHDEL